MPIFWGREDIMAVFQEVWYILSIVQEEGKTGLTKDSKAVRRRGSEDGFIRQRNKDELQIRRKGLFCERRGSSVLWIAFKGGEQRKGGGS